MRLIGVAVVLVVLTLAPAPADAQPSGKPRIGLLGAGNAAADSRLLSAFRQGLSDMGWIENQTVMIEYRWAEGYSERLPALVQVRIKVDVIVATGIVRIRAAKDATSTIPILFVVLNDPVSTGNRSLGLKLQSIELRQDSQGRQACRSPGRAAHEV